MGKVWVLPYRPEKFRTVAARLLTATPNLQARWNTPLTEAMVERNRIVSLNGIAVGAVIDCSGSAEVARLIGAECLATDATTQAPAVIFPLQNVTHELNSPAAVAQVLLPLARAGFPPLNFQTSLEANTVTVKFTGRADQVPDVIGFLKAKVSGFENCSTPLTEFTPANRAGRMIVGQYLLTGADVLAGRKFPDAVARGAWPIEQWSADGVARFKYLPPGAHYDIPARALRAAHVENLFMAGKTISADVDAIASARVMGCCLATGAAAGNLAAALPRIRAHQMTHSFDELLGRDFSPRSGTFAVLSGILSRHESACRDWTSVPLVDKDILSERNLDFLCVPRERVVEIVTTSGTTGQPLLWMLTEADVQRLAQRMNDCPSAVRA